MAIDTPVRTPLDLRVFMWLAKGQAPERLVAAALFYLNRMAKEASYRYQRDEIYDLKNRVVKAFCTSGLCTEVGIHKKELQCWDCSGTGIDSFAYSNADGDYEEGECLKCGGTGLYRTLAYYHFHFDIGGQHYAFHQPDWAVTWPVETVAHERAFDEREPKEVNLRYQNKPLYLAIVRAYLAKQGDET